MRQEQWQVHDASAGTCGFVEACGIAEDILLASEVTLSAVFDLGCGESACCVQSVRSYMPLANHQGRPLSKLSSIRA